jgi:hypothetical protein
MNLVKNYLAYIGLRVLVVGFFGVGVYQFIFTNMYDGMNNIVLGAMWFAVMRYEDKRVENEISKNMLSMCEAIHPGIIDEVTEKYIKEIDDQVENL